MIGAMGQCGCNTMLTPVAKKSVGGVSGSLKINLAQYRDMQAFAKSEGVARVTTAIRSGVPTLIVTSRED